VLATNENDVLDEFFRTGVYRPRGDGGNARHLEPVDGYLEGLQFRALRLRPGRARRRRRARVWAKVDAGGSFDLRGTPYLARLPEFGFVSGTSSARRPPGDDPPTFEKYGVMIDPHTADGLKVALAYREAGVPMVVLETAQPVKFAETLREALGREPGRPKELEGLEALPQRVEVMAADAAAVKAFIAALA
jgi:threonine synthase